MSDDESTNVTNWSSHSMIRGPLDSPPPSVNVEVAFGALSRRGPLRSENDDHYLILRMVRHQETLLTSLPQGGLPKHVDECGYAMVIADGMAGTGETASRLAIAALVHFANYFGKWHVRVDEPIAEEMMDRAKRYFRSIDSTLRQASLQSASLRTTLTALYSVGSELFFAHVGHSRAYVFRDDQLMQLTRDHTLARRRPGKTVIVDVAASVRDSHHIVTQLLGGGGAGARRIDVERCGLMDGDVILLCTNGLTDVAEDARIANALRMYGSPDDQCRALVDLAANSGSNDDVTALVAHYRIPE